MRRARPGAIIGKPLHVVQSMFSARPGYDSGHDALAGRRSRSWSMSLRRTSWSKLLLPKEHGSWAFVLEPVALGLLLAPSWPGLSAALGVVALFLAHRPAWLWWRAHRAGGASADARKATLLAAPLGLTGSFFALADPRATLCWSLAGGLALGFAWLAGRVAQLHLGRVMLGAHLCVPVAAGLVFLGGGDSRVALMAAGLLVARIVPTVLFVRSYLGNTPDSRALRWPALLLSASAPAAICAITSQWLLAAPLVVLAGRAVLGLGLRRYAGRPKQIGLLEAAYGALAVAGWAWALNVN